MKQDNRGFSLVELIIVIAIMAVMVGFVTISMSILTGANARECAQKVSGQLNSTKTASMSRFDETMKLYKGSDGYYTENTSYTIGADGTRLAISGSEIVKVGKDTVDITVYLTDGSDFEISDSRTITVSYNHATGEQDSVVVAGTENAGVYIDKIVFEQGSRSYTIDMVHKTGKHSLSGS